jgi:hypothetical protein
MKLKMEVRVSVHNSCSQIHVFIVILISLVRYVCAVVAFNFFVFCVTAPDNVV